MCIKTYKDLSVFRETYRLALDVSRDSKSLRGYEQFELGRQLRRAARSIPVNIVEGWAERSSAREFKILQTSMGSCEECKLGFEMARDEGYFREEE